VLLLLLGWLLLQIPTGALQLLCDQQQLLRCPVPAPPQLLLTHRHLSMQAQLQPSLL
jgi:hypothetical protein